MLLTLTFIGDMTGKIMAGDAVVDLGNNNHVFEH